MNIIRKYHTFRKDIQNNIDYWEFISEEDYFSFLNNKENCEFNEEDLNIIREKLGKFVSFKIEKSDQPLYRSGSLYLRLTNSNDPYFMWITKYPDEWYLIWIVMEYCSFISNNEEDCQYIKCDQTDGLSMIISDIADNISAIY